jgi:hypothetical protein
VADAEVKLQGSGQDFFEIIGYFGSGTGELKAFQKRELIADIKPCLYNSENSGFSDTRRCQVLNGDTVRPQTGPGTFWGLFFVFEDDQS